MDELTCAGPPGPGAPPCTDPATYIRLGRVYPPAAPLSMCAAHGRSAAELGYLVVPLHGDAERVAGATDTPGHRYPHLFSVDRGPGGCRWCGTTPDTWQHVAGRDGVWVSPELLDPPLRRLPTTPPDGTTALYDARHWLESAASERLVTMHTAVDSAEVRARLETVVAYRRTAQKLAEMIAAAAEPPTLDDVLDGWPRPAPPTAPGAAATAYLRHVGTYVLDALADLRLAAARRRANKRS